MGMLTGKKILITGISSNRSIAYGIAEACAREGAELIISYNNERFKDRVEGFAETFHAKTVVRLDVSSDESLDLATLRIAEAWPQGFDGFVHSIGWAPREAISGNFLDGISRDGFLAAMNISVYSYAALAKKFLPLMEGHNASMLTLSYLGGERIVPNYNTMGVCKAALEATTRYIASDVGPKGLRANTISCGPIKTLAASGIKNFGTMLSQSREVSPLRKLITIEDVGNTAAFLLSDLAKGITAETLYVDAGFNALASVLPPKNQEAE